MGGMALSHNALPSRERIVGGKLVIEAIDHVVSVDVVQKGGTNSTLWEHKETRPVATTFKAILESWVAKKSPARKAFAAKRLLEDDSMPLSAADVPAETPPEAEPDDALWGGFTAAIDSLLAKYIGGEMDAAAVSKAITKYVKAHAKLTGTAEPDDAPVEEEDDTMSDDDKKKKADDDKKAAAKESLESKLQKLEAKDACRTLCEAADFKPSPTQLKALMLLESEADRKALIEESKGTATPKPAPGTGKPKSGAPTPKVPVTESAAPKNKDEFLTSIRD